MTKANLDEIAELKAFAEELGAAPEWTSILMPRQDGSKDNVTSRLEPEPVVNLEAMLFREQQETETSLEELSKAIKWEKKMDKGQPIPMRGRRKSISYRPLRGVKALSSITRLGLFCFNGGLKEGWKMLGDRIRSIKPSRRNRCFDCRLRSFCSSCPAKAKLECGDMNACPPYYRRLAELRRDKKTMDERRWTK